MQPSQSTVSKSVSAASAKTLGGAKAPGSKARTKKPTPVDPSQPTLQQIFARAAVSSKPTYTQAAGPGPCGLDLGSGPTAPPAPVSPVRQLVGPINPQSAGTADEPIVLCSPCSPDTVPGDRFRAASPAHLTPDIASSSPSSGTAPTSTTRWPALLGGFSRALHHVAAPTTAASISTDSSTPGARRPEPAPSNGLTSLLLTAAAIPLTSSSDSEPSGGPASPIYIPGSPSDSASSFASAVSAQPCGDGRDDSEAAELARPSACGPMSWGPNVSSSVARGTPGGTIAMHNGTTPLRRNCADSPGPSGRGPHDGSGPARRHHDHREAQPGAGAQATATGADSTSEDDSGHAREDVSLAARLAQLRFGKGPKVKTTGGAQQPQHLQQRPGLTHEPPAGSGRGVGAGAQPRQDAETSAAASTSVVAAVSGQQQASAGSARLGAQQAAQPVAPSKTASRSAARPFGIEGQSSVPGTAPAEPAAESRIRVQKAAAAQPTALGEAGHTPGKERGKRGTKANATRSGKSLSGELLWTEMTAEERAAGGGPAWIRWEPLPDSSQTCDQSGGRIPAKVFQLFSVDVETVDFMRGPARFPRPDQVRLLEVAAVDLGPYDDPYARRDGQGASSGTVFSTLINCGRSFKNAKTALHNGITWAETSRPGVPGTAEALERFFAFVQRRCEHTAAGVAAAAASGKGPDAAAADRGEVEVVPVLMAHNGNAFDFPVLRSECGRVGVEWPQDWWYLDTLALSRVLWAKANWPVLPADAGATGDDAEDEADLGGQGSAAGGKRSLSMDALKLWADVASAGKAHRAEVDALDLAEIWASLFERFGRPALEHLAQVRGSTAAAKAVAGPMEQLGLLSLAARADGLLRHMEAAVLPLLPAPPAPQPTSRVLTVSQLREFVDAGRVHLHKTRGGGGGGGMGFWNFNVVRERPAAMAAVITSMQGLPPAAGSSSGPAASWPSPVLEPFVVLLRGVKLRYVYEKSSSNKRDDAAPRWELALAAAGGGKSAKGEGATGSDEVSELAELVDGLARQAAVEARGDSGSRSQLYSCRDFKKTGITVQLLGECYPGPALRQLNWRPLASVSAYDKKTTSYKPVQWAPLMPYMPSSSGGWDDVSQSQEGGPGDDPAGSLESVKKHNLDRIIAQLPLPAVNGSEVLDVAVWPQLVWVSNWACGAKLVALHLVRRSA